MKCADMLVQLLEAEQGELGGLGESHVAVHVRECARCRAVAVRLLTDTRVLATGLPAAGARRRIASCPMMWAGAFATAAIILLLTLPTTEPGPAAASVPAATRTGSRAVAPDVAVIPASAVRYADAVAATPVRFAASQSTEEAMAPPDSNGVSVTPAAGIRSAVLATRNSKITVVWLY